jgi:hypothetical protein
MGINSAIDAELAYRRERITQHYRPWRRVGTERRTASRDHRKGSVNAAGASVIAVSR